MDSGKIPKKFYSFYKKAEAPILLIIFSCSLFFLYEMSQKEELTTTKIILISSAGFALIDSAIKLLRKIIT